MKRPPMSCCSVVLAILFQPTPVAGQREGHGLHPPMPGQEFYIQCRVRSQNPPMVVEVPVRLPHPGAATKLDQPVELPAPIAPIRLTRYLPQARRAQDVRPVNGDDGKPAVELAIVGPTQSFRRWLLAGDMERNRLTSFIGAWRYMAVAGPSQRDDLFEQFKNELTREPRLRISRADRSAVGELVVRPGRTRTFRDLGCAVRVVAFHPHFAIDEKTDKPVNQSDKRVNPAAQIELEADGKTETRWVFAKFPDFEKREGQALPYRVTLDCPAETRGAVPDFVLLTVNGRAHEVWVRDQGRVESKALLLNQKINVGASQYTFHLARFIPSGRLVEVFVPTDGRDGLPALQFEANDAGELRTFWLGLNQQRIVPTPGGAMAVVFASRHAAPPGAHP